MSTDEPGGHKEGSLGCSRDYLESSSRYLGGWNTSLVTAQLEVSLEQVQWVLFLSWATEKVLLISEAVRG